MALKKIQETPVGSKSAVQIFSNPAYGEFIVKTVVNGKVQGGKDGGYFTDDKQDALNTAASEVQRLSRSKQHAMTKSGATKLRATKLRATKNHATTKSDTWDSVASVSADWYADAGGVASNLADELERKFGIERMIEGSYPNYRVLAKGDERTLEKARVYAGQWLANVSHQASSRHHATKKTSAQLDREIAEALAKEPGSEGPRVLKISPARTFAGQRSITANVQYPGEAPSRVEFVGPSASIGGAGPVVMISRGHQTFVTDPSRFGDFGPDWVRRFFERA